jgi:hypothetical protein
LFWNLLQRRLAKFLTLHPSLVYIGSEENIGPANS